MKIADKFIITNKMRKYIGVKMEAKYDNSGKQTKVIVNISLHKVKKDHQDSAEDVSLFLDDTYTFTPLINTYDPETKFLGVGYGLNECKNN